MHSRQVVQHSSQCMSDRHSLLVTFTECTLSTKTSNRQYEQLLCRWQILSNYWPLRRAALPPLTMSQKATLAAWTPAETTSTSSTLLTCDQSWKHHNTTQVIYHQSTLTDSVSPSQWHSKPVSPHHTHTHSQCQLVTPTLIDSVSSSHPHSLTVSAHHTHTNWQCQPITPTLTDSVSSSHPHSLTVSAHHTHTHWKCQPITPTLTKSVSLSHPHSFALELVTN